MPASFVRFIPALEVRPPAEPVNDTIMVSEPERRPIPVPGNNLLKFNVELFVFPL